MNLDNLITTICTLVAEKMGEEYEVSVRQVRKNNGVLLHGLIIKDEGTNITPTIYLEEFVEEVKAGVPIETIVECILEIYQKQKIAESLDVNALLQFERIKENIIFSLINTAKNQELLKDIPNIPYLDLSIIFKVSVPSPFSDSATFTIHNSHLEFWQKTIEDLYQVAYENTPTLFPPKIQDMLSIIKDLGVDVDEDMVSMDQPLMFVLSNTEKINGCSCILYPKVLEEFSSTIDCDLFVLPSSVHEVILLPALDVVDKNQLSFMVQDVNSSMVSQEEFLSNSIYYYSHETDQLDLLSF